MSVMGKEDFLEWEIRQLFWQWQKERRNMPISLKIFSITVMNTLVNIYTTTLKHTVGLHIIGPSIKGILDLINKII